MKFKFNNIYTYSAAFSMISLMLIVFLIYPAMKDIKYNSNKILENKNSLALSIGQNHAIDSFKNNYPSYQTNLNKMNQILIDPKDPVGVIRFFETASQESRINTTINLVESGKKGNSKGLSTIVFNISANGSFSDLLNFSERLEKSHYLIRIKNLSMSKSSEDSRDNTIDAQFSVYVGTQNSN